ncbi:MAG: hypothetical protein IKO83_06375 [Oscillospiraceae bacterium]|nr:hypothetical protein [Oscillospiraceae bacterium]
MKDWDPRYDELLYRPRPLSAEHPAVPLRERAAQFAAFQALNGFEEEIEEEARWTEEAFELDESRKEILDARLRCLVGSRRHAVFLWFRPDGKKAGGGFVRSCGAVKKVDLLARVLCLENGEKIPLEQLYDVIGEDAPETDA